MIRGVALCGLVPINILDFAPREDLFMSSAGLEGFELGLWFFVHLFGSGKFISIFAMLFGAGILLATAKADAAGEPVAGKYLKRLGWLGIFGLLHAYLIWHGDILVAYAVTGFVLFWCRKWKAKVHFLLGILMLGVFAAVVLAIAILLLLLAPELDMTRMEEEWNADLDQQVEALRGNWLEQMPIRALYAFAIQLLGIPLLVFWIAGGRISPSKTRSSPFSPRIRRWSRVGMDCDSRRSSGRPSSTSSRTPRSTWETSSANRPRRFSGNGSTRHPAPGGSTATIPNGTGPAGPSRSVRT